MFAKVVKQNEEIRQPFNKRIREKLEDDKSKIKEKADSFMPSFISSIAKPIIDIVCEADTFSKSPTKQNKRHYILFKKWLGYNSENNINLQNYIYSLVIFYTSWVRANQCCMPVFENSINAVSYINTFKEKTLSDELINLIVEKIQFAKPIDINAWQEKKTFIRRICNDLDVEATDTKGLNSSIHDYFQYCGTYIDNGKEKATTPDLTISKNLNWHNKENKVRYCAVVEVKSPYLKECIYDKNFENYPSKLIQKLESYLSAKKNNKLILTDAIKWEFYIKNKEDKKIELIRTFRLYELYNVREWTWKKEEFEELKNFLKEFLKKEED